MLLELHRPSPSPSLRFLARAPSPTPPPPSPSSGRATPRPNRPESKVHGRPPWMLRSKLRPARRSPSSGCPWPDSGCCKQPHTLLYQPQLTPFLFPRRNRAPHELPRWQQWLFGADPVPPLLPCLESPKRNPLTLLSPPMPLASRMEAGSAIPMELSELVLTVMATKGLVQQLE